MAKIIKIDGDNIYIGSDNGDFQEVKRSDCQFKPILGDIVDVFTSENKVVVMKADVKSKNNSSQQDIESTHKVNKTIYCLLAFLLGGIGLHKFYEGKVFTGILYFVFSWTFIPAIFALVDFFAALFKSSDKKGNIIV